MSLGGLTNAQAVAAFSSSASSTPQRDDALEGSTSPLPPTPRRESRVLETGSIPVVAAPATPKASVGLLHFRLEIEGEETSLTMEATQPAKFVAQLLQLQAELLGAQG